MRISKDLDARSPLSGALPLTYTRTRLETRLPSGTKLLRPRGIGRRRRLPQCQAPPPSHFTSCLLLHCALGDLCCYPLTLIHASCLRRLAGPHVPCMATAGTPKVSPVDLQMACARETRVETSQCRGAQHVLQLSQSGFHSRAFTVGLWGEGGKRKTSGAVVGTDWSLWLPLTPSRVHRVVDSVTDDIVAPFR